jgi:hypothetical protein
VDATSIFEEEMALGAARLAEPEEGLGPVDIARLEIRWRQSHVGCGADEIVFGEVNVSHLIAAVDAVGLTGETETVHESLAPAIVTGSGRHK